MTDTPPGRRARASEPDPSVRRVERDAAIACAVMAGLALLLQRGQPGGAVGVIGGGALMAYSFRAIRGGVDAMVRRVSPAARPGGSGEANAQAGRIGWAVLGFVARYLMIGLAAWLLLVKLHAHPVGLFAGVTAPVLALGVEAFRLQHRP